ncbi:MAG: PLDc_N domain-containing protein [Clostridiaceae bacterium]|nr:PLDc_N domain-containing protein [Clostridiaceae bacterium]
MTNMTSTEILQIAIPILVIQLSLMVFCLYKLSKDTVKYLPKWFWALVIVFGQLLGPIVYLILGREKE